MIRSIKYTNNDGFASWMLIGAVVVVAVFGVMIYNSYSAQTAVTTENSSSLQTAPTQESSSIQASSLAASGAGTLNETQSEIKSFELEAGSFYYKPNVIKVKKGDTVKVTITSKDMMHDFNVDELNVKVPLTKAGETNSATFIASEMGTFEFYCSVDSHRAKGQVGTLVIEE